MATIALCVDVHALDHYWHYFIMMSLCLLHFAAAPGAIVNEVSVEVNYQGIDNQVRMSWDAIPEDQWNGRPKGYFVSVVSIPKDCVC